MVAVFTTGCFDEITKVYEGPAVVEFAQYNQPYSAANNYTATYTFDAGSTNETVEFSLDLNLIAEHFDRDTNINVIIADQQLDDDGEVEEETTATEGTHFNILSGNTATFPANSSFSTVDIELLSSGLNDGESVQFIIELTATDDLEPADNYRYYRVVVEQDTP